MIAWYSFWIFDIFIVWPTIKRNPECQMSNVKHKRHSKMTSGSENSRQNAIISFRYYDRVRYGLNQWIRPPGSPGKKHTSSLQVKCTKIIFIISTNSHQQQHEMSPTNSFALAVWWWSIWKLIFFGEFNESLSGRCHSGHYGFDPFVWSKLLRSTHFIHSTVFFSLAFLRMSIIQK